MPSTHQVTHSFPLPSYLSPELVLEQLQNYESLITPNPNLLKYNRRPVAVEELIDDPFFTETGSKLEAFEVTDRIILLPLAGFSSWCYKDVRIPAVFQSFETGVRYRADAQGGVRVWSTYEIRRRDPTTGSSAESVVVSPGAGDWELVEQARVECSHLVKPFVIKNFESAHREICQRMIDEMVRTSAKDHLREMPPPVPVK